MATPAFLWPELGTIDAAATRAERLEQMAKLVTHPNNGRFQRTIVNRLWQRLFGWSVQGFLAKYPAVKVTDALAGGGGHGH